MWFGFWRSREVDKKEDEDRARIQMELALSQHENPYKDIIQDMRNADEIRRIQYAQRESQRTLIENAVSAAQRCGMISNEELAKYYLDETGLYIPKLIKNDN